ncbi:MAG: MBL fold metallo-hydrolase [Streptosporangiales bacterium]|nr:MBL fold metallo-hydrolase [Streptosporangiales bacterium]
MQPVDRMVVTTVVENYVDMLLADEPQVTRTGLAHHFDPKKTNPLGENGIALHVLLEWDRYRYQLLFDTGMSGQVLLHNAAAMDVDLDAVDHLVISHGHPDHYGGLLALLDQRTAALPISMHDDALLPRYLRLASGQVAPYYNHDLTRGAIEAHGGRQVSHDGPLEVGPGALATGPIPREVAFEQPPSSITTPNALIQLVDGEMRPDSVPDDQALVVRLGDGIVVFTGCSHAGVVNTVKHAIEITGVDRVRAVFGGFHLGFPGTPESKTDATIEELRNLDVDLLCPMHCTGMAAMMQIRAAFPDRFLLNCTGTEVVLDS